ncbi:MAG TPA: protein phosphatase 2C domain-containing protein [Alphaproteobacteria bacterium]|nr:protein phosphatase 2C domain-containing protein [Alphaproteobacteria bacterium]
MGARTPAFRFASASRTHVGRVRKRNEDAVLERPDLGLWAVADGMGGHERGDYASRQIVGSLNETAAPTSGAAFLRDVKTRLSAVNQTLRSAALAAGHDAMIGSTVVALLAFEGSYCCVWAGDSRFYLLRNGELRQITRDHSYVQELIDKGEPAPEALDSHRFDNVVTNAVGAGEELVLDEVRDRLRPDDVLLLCSDGLTRMVSDWEIARALEENPVDAAADRLIEETLARGAKDNVTVVIVRCIPIDMG